MTNASQIHFEGEVLLDLYVEPLLFFSVGWVGGLWKGLLAIIWLVSFGRKHEGQKSYHLRCGFGPQDGTWISSVVTAASAAVGPPKKPTDSRSEVSRSCIFFYQRSMYRFDLARCLMLLQIYKLEHLQLTVYQFNHWCIKMDLNGPFFLTGLQLMRTWLGWFDIWTCSWAQVAKDAPACLGF